jgi:hypothetical protein
MRGFWIDAIIAKIDTWIYFIHIKNFRLCLYTAWRKICSLYSSIERDTVGLFLSNASMAVAVLCLFLRIQLRTANKNFNED